MLCYYNSALVSAGSNGQVADSYLQKSDLGSSQRSKYPLPLLKVMTRYAEDLLWANKTATASEVYTFLVNLTEGRAEAMEITKRTITNYT